MIAMQHFCSKHQLSLNVHSVYHMRDSYLDAGMWQQRAGKQRMVETEPQEVVAPSLPHPDAFISAIPTMRVETWL